MGVSLIIRETDTGEYCAVNVSKAMENENYLVVAPMDIFIDSIAKCDFPTYIDGEYEQDLPDWDNPLPIFWLDCEHTMRSYLYGHKVDILNFLRYGEHTGKWKIEIEDIY